MKQLKKLGAKLRSNKKSNHNPANSAVSTSLAQQLEGSSSTTLAGPSRTLTQNPEITSSESSSGLLSRATHVDASHGVFVDIGRDQIQYNLNVAGDQYIVKVGMQVRSKLLQR
jgi:hypothetical protein